MEIDRDALVITRDEITINAAPGRVWDLFTNISAWPEWQTDIESASLDGPLALSTTFYWTTAGMNITSTVGELIPGQRIVWSGLAQGIMAIHVWKFSAGDGGTLVQTEESWQGVPVRAQIDFFQNALDRSIRSWLGHLKAAAER